MGNPDAFSDTTPSPRDPEQRLEEAYLRYEQAYRDARPGTRSEVELACARLDLSLLLIADESLPDDVVEQIGRDAECIIRTTPPLDPYPSDGV